MIPLLEREPLFCTVVLVGVGKNSIFRQVFWAVAVVIVDSFRREVIGLAVGILSSLNCGKTLVCSAAEN